MRRTRQIVKMAVVAALITAAALGALSFFTEAQAGGPCRCPLIYAPVQCEKGRVYSNLCVAECHNAKNCVPLGL